MASASAPPRADPLDASMRAHTAGDSGGMGRGLESRTTTWGPRGRAAPAALVWGPYECVRGGPREPNVMARGTPAPTARGTALVALTRPLVSAVALSADSAVEAFTAACGASSRGAVWARAAEECVRRWGCGMADAASGAADRRAVFGSRCTVAVDPPIAPREDVPSRWDARGADADTVVTTAGM